MWGGTIDTFAGRCIDDITDPDALLSLRSARMTSP